MEARAALEDAQGFALLVLPKVTAVYGDFSLPQTGHREEFHVSPLYCRARPSLD